MKKIFLIAFAILVFVSCKCSSDTPKQIDNIVGADQDAHGCKSSAGYVWSEVKQDCIRVWEIGVSLSNIANKENNCFVVFSNDSTNVELFNVSNSKNIIIAQKDTYWEGGAYRLTKSDKEYKLYISGELKFCNTNEQ